MSKNIAASVRARLGQLAKVEGQTLDFMIERFAIGRLLSKLSERPEGNQFVLKGAQLFSLWSDSPHRPTRDIDFLGYGDPSEDKMLAYFKDLLDRPSVPDDGLLWGDVKAGPIREDQRYGGIRVTAPVSLAGAKVTIQIDIGYGDSITPEAAGHEWKELLDFPSARLLAYPPETVVAEKFEAAVNLAMANSRMKDFFDLDWLARHQEFDARVLGLAIYNTFERRQTPIPEKAPVALTEEFSLDPMKQTQWAAFLRKSRLDADSLEVVIQRLETFLAPFYGSQKPELTMRWVPGRGWK